MQVRGVESFPPVPMLGSSTPLTCACYSELCHVATGVLCASWEVTARVMCATQVCGCK
jgi:hypothetical protein